MLGGLVLVSPGRRKNYMNMAINTLFTFKQHVPKLSPNLEWVQTKKMFFSSCFMVCPVCEPNEPIWAKRLLPSGSMKVYGKFILLDLPWTWHCEPQLDKICHNFHSWAHSCPSLTPSLEIVSRFGPGESNSNFCSLLLINHEITTVTKTSCEAILGTISKIKQNLTSRKSSFN